MKGNNESILTMKRIREEELLVLTEECDGGRTAAIDAKMGDSDLELGFRYLEEIEEEAEMDRFAFLNENHWDVSLGSLDMSNAYTYSLEDTIPKTLKIRHRSFEEVEAGITQAPSTTFSGPVTPKSFRCLASSQQFSNLKQSPAAHKLALPEATTADKLPIENDYKAIRKRKGGVGSGNPDYSVLDVAAESNHRASLKKIQGIPLTPPISGKTLRHQAIDIQLTPSSLDQPSLRKASVSPTVDHWCLNISESPRKPSENFGMASPEDVEELSIDCLGPPTPKPMINQNQLIKATFTDKVDVPDQDSALPISSWNDMPFDVSPSQDDNGFEQVQQETKQTKFEQQFSPLRRQTKRYVTCNESSGSMEGRAGLQNPVSGARVAFESLPQTGCSRFGVSSWTSEFPQVLIDLTEPEEDDPPLKICKKSSSPSDSVLQRLPELKGSSDADPTWAKEGCDRVNPKSAQDSSHMQHEADVGGVACQKYPSSCSTLASDGVLMGGFSIACALQNYVCLRKEGKTNTERKLSQYFPVIKPLAANAMKKDHYSEDSKNVESQLMTSPIARPQYIIPTGRHYVVVSAYFLRNRRLAYRVQRLYPGADFIERDFSLHERSSSRSQHRQDTTSQSTYDNSDEADLTVSPGTGIILTTLQKIRQCSLPGQAVRLIVRERVARVAARYERLIILVSKDSTIDYPASESGNVAPHESDSDYEAAIDFIGFCSTLKQDTQAMFIAGKEEQLAEWIVAMMVKHAGVDMGIKLFSEETTWELFLRRAGFNSFAAQAVIGELAKQSTAAEISTAGEVGLIAFVRMSVGKRVEKFEKMFGGSELLKRVSRQLDASW